jgi:RNA 2',3'-cyclic 3'-phosphodiesterase
VPADNLHLTLRFLGNVESSGLAALASSLRKVAFEPFELRLGKLGTFGRGKSVRVVWLGPEEGIDSLVDLAREVEARCAELGFAAEERPYHPHLTLARSHDRSGEPAPALPAPPDLQPWAVAGFRLYRSLRGGKAGADYSVIAEFGS